MCNLMLIFLKIVVLAIAIGKSEKRRHSRVCCRLSTHTAALAVDVVKSVEFNFTSSSAFQET